MRKMLFVGLVAACASTPIAVRAQDGRIVHEFPEGGMGAFFSPLFDSSDWHRKFVRTYLNEGAEAALPIAAKEARDGNPVAMRILGLAYGSGDGVARDDRAGFAWLRKAAARGDATAMYAIGLAYWRGAGVTRNAITAQRWLIAASSRGERRARAALAQMARLSG